MLFECRTMYDIVIWGLDRGWKKIDKTHHAGICKIILGAPRSATKKVGELELWGGSKRGGVLRSRVSICLAKSGGEY